MINWILILGLYDILSLREWPLRQHRIRSLYTWGGAQKIECLAENFEWERTPVHGNCYFTLFFPVFHDVLLQASIFDYKLTGKWNRRTNKMDNKVFFYFDGRWLKPSKLLATCPMSAMCAAELTVTASRHTCDHVVNSNEERCGLWTQRLADCDPQ